MPNVGKRVPLVIPPGTNPDPDTTDNSGNAWLSTDGARFLPDGRLRAIEGNEEITYIQNGGQSGSDSSALSILGYVSFVQSYVEGTTEYTLIGTHKRLYVLKDIDNTAPNVILYNITPISTTTNAIANSIATDYRTLGSAPLTTTSGSATVVVADSGHVYKVGDRINISGATATGGISAGNLNLTNTTITAITANTWSYSAGASASSSATGGGGSVVVATALLTLTAASNGLTNGDRIKIADATTTGGVPDTEINAEHIVRNKQTNSFQIMATTKATSSVSGGGGASTTYQKPIITASSSAFATLNYSIGLFGVNKVIIRMNNKLYTWANDTSTAPVLTSGAPDAAYVFESSNQIIALGASSVDRRFKASDVGNETSWTPGATTLAFEDDIEGIAKLISHAPSGDLDLLFTNHEVVAARFVGLPKIWDFEIIMTSDGIISQNARVVVDYNVFWMGRNNFYLFNGGSISILPNNTLQEFVFKRLNQSYLGRIFAFHISKWNEVGWFYPVSTSFGGETETNGLTWNTVMYNYKNNIWSLDVPGVSRTAAEQFKQGNLYPIMIDGRYSIDASTQIASSTYRHNKENTVRGMTVYTPYQKIADGDNLMEILAIYPDMILEGGNLKITCNTKEEANSTVVGSVVVDNITSTDTRLDVRANGRYRQLKIETKTGVTDFVLGKTHEEIKVGTPR